MRRRASAYPLSPWENGYNERFDVTLRDELLNGEIFFTLPEAEVLIESWRREYNQVRPHSSLDYRQPAPEAWSVDQGTPRTDRPASAAGCRGRVVSDHVAQALGAGQGLRPKGAAPRKAPAKPAAKGKGAWASMTPAQRAEGIA